MAKKVFTQHKNGDVSIRLTPIEREMLSCFLGKLSYGVLKEHTVFTEALIRIDKRRVEIVPLDYNDNKVNISAIFFKSKE